MIIFQIWKGSVKWSLRFEGSKKLCCKTLKCDANADVRVTTIIPCTFVQVSYYCSFQNRICSVFTCMFLLLYTFAHFVHKKLVVFTVIFCL